MWRWLIEHVGLAKPHRFERTVAILFALLLSVLAGAAIVYYRWIGELSLETPRFWYFSYLATLLGLAVLGARWPRCTAVVLSLAALELGLGVGSDVLERLGHAPEELLPVNGAPQTPRNWHPLLHGVVRPGTVRQVWEGEIRYNSLGLRGPEHSPEELRGKTVVALFGGSTTEDIAVPGGKSWGERLEQILGHRFAVINHGSGWYSTVQHVLLTAFYERPFGVEPDCAVYYTGGIDIRNSHFRNLDPGYVDFHIPALIDALAVRPIDQILPSVSPTLRYLGRLMMLAVDTVRPVESPDGEAGGSPDPNLEAIYERNVRTISAINRQRGIKTVWIGEVMDPVTLTRNWTSEEPWAPFVPGSAVWPLLSHLHDVLRRAAMALGDVYIDVPARQFTPDDFVDGEHFSPEGAQKFADLIAPGIGEACRR